MKRTLTILSAFVLVAALAMVAIADVTGDFKVVSATYTNNGDANGGDVSVSGTVNHGAIQSGKQVVVEVSYEYSFEYQISTTQTIPARCPDSTNVACSRANPNSALFRPTTITVTQTLPSSGMKAITEPTVTSSGRLNPKGKVTGYNWAGGTSIAPLDSIVDPNLIPDGATLVSGSVQITAVSYTAYLKDSGGNQIADTVVNGTLFPAP